MVTLLESPFVSPLRFCMDRLGLGPLFMFIRLAWLAVNALLTPLSLASLGLQVMGPGRSLDLLRIREMPFVELARGALDETR